VFTNLSRDHLDFHHDMTAYYQAKRRLFEGLSGGPPRAMVLNADDAHYEDLRSIAPQRVISYGFQAAAQIHPVRLEHALEATRATFATPLGALDIQTSLLGRANVFNVGAAIGVGIALDLPASAVVRGVEELSSVPGRFEAVRAGQPFRVIVDYAHTDDALLNVLQSARELTRGRLILVFGCGGDRDRTKRPLMGQAAAGGSDLAFVTSDNPRGEDPRAIIREIEEGLKGAAYRVEIDRREAIRGALLEAREGDTVLIAGKGHETTQTIGTASLPFDDRLIAKETLDELNAGRN